MASARACAEAGSGAREETGWALVGSAGGPEGERAHTQEAHSPQSRGQLLDVLADVIQPPPSYAHYSPLPASPTMSWRNASLVFEAAEAGGASGSAVFGVVLGELEGLFSVERRSIEPQLYVLSALLGL